MWNPQELTKNVRLDDGTSDIDSLDSFEYTEGLAPWLDENTEALGADRICLYQGIHDF